MFRTKCVHFTEFARWYFCEPSLLVKMADILEYRSGATLLFKMRQSSGLDYTSICIMAGARAAL